MHKIRQVSLLREWLVAVLLIFIVFLSGCSEIPKNDIEGIEFSYKTYIKESVDSCQSVQGFRKDELTIVENLENKFFRGTVWSEVYLCNTTNQKHSLVISNYDDLNYDYSLYRRNSENGLLELISGFENSDYGDGRSINFNRPNFKVDILPNATEYYYIHSTSDGRIVRSIPSVDSLDKYLILVNRNVQLSIFFYGSLSIIFLINIFFWSSFRNKIHGYYSGYILFTIMLYLGLDGYLFGNGISNHLIDHFIFFVLRGFLLCLVFFTILFLKIEELAPKFNIWAKVVSFIVVLGMSSYQLIFFKSSISYLHRLENVISSLFLFLVIIMLVISIRHKRREVRYYLVALILYVIFITFGGLLPYIKSLEYLSLDPFILYKIGTTVEVLIFTYTIIKVLSIKEKSLKERNIENESKMGNIELENKALKARIADVSKQKLEFMTILKLLESNLNDEQEWADFKTKVNEINPSFIQNLQAKHDELSKNDLRLLLLVKIGFTQKEISKMLFIAESSVKKSKQRIRKKLNLSFDVTLSEFLEEY